MTAGDFYSVMESAKLPPVERWNPDPCGDSHMRIAADGQWFHEGTRITRPELVRLFAGLLKREDSGHVLVTPVEKLTIIVEDAPFIAVSVAREGERIVFTTNVGDRVALDGEHALRVAGDVPYVHVRGGLEAKVARSAWYHLAEMAEDHDGCMGVTSAGLFFPLGPA
jgi:hypothetical protein